MEEMEDEKRPRSAGRKIKLAVSFLLLLAVAATGYWYAFVRGTVYSDDARIDGDLVDLAPEVGGTLDRVLVREGDTVTRGQTLFELDRTLLQARLARANWQRSEKLLTAHVLAGVILLAGLPLCLLLQRTAGRERRGPAPAR